MPTICRGRLNSFPAIPTLPSQAKEATWLRSPLDETVRSLSAIVLDDGYYEFIESNTETVGNIQIPSALCMIPLKMRAHIDNNRLHAEGVPIAEKVLKKHRKDVCELAYLLAPEARLKLDGQLGEDARSFIEDLRRYAQSLPNMKRRAELEQALGILSGVYL